MKLIVNTPEEMTNLAGEIGNILQIEDIIILNGALAAGKTFFVTALTHAIGSKDSISSPTYSIAQFYQTPNFTVLHMDAYRLKGIEEFRDLGLDEYFEEGVTLIEWGAEMTEDFTDYLTIDISFLEGETEKRQLHLTATGPRWQQALKQLEQPLAAYQL